jgi:2-methylcitrate dehydratase PrpD
MSDMRRATTAQALAEWTTRLAVGDVPPDVLHQAKRCVIDSIACIVGGLDLMPMRLLLDVLSTESAQGPVPIPGTAIRLGITAAAHFGAQAANVLDVDDSFRAGAPSHPGATVVPPALAVAAARRCSGLELLLAVVAGFEVSLRIGRSVLASPARRERIMGFAPWQSFGAATAAARLLGLPPPAIRSAFGLTGAQAPVASGRRFLASARPYPWIKNPYGIASEVGVLSALLAERGFHGDQDIFDGAHGFWIMAGSDRHQPDLATEALGDAWLIMDVGFKPYACCRWTHTMIDAIRMLKPELGDMAIARVRITGFSELACSLDAPPPGTIIDAQFNARYVAALELAGHSPEFGMSEAHLTDPAVLRLMGLATLIHDPSFDTAYHERGELPARVEIDAADGKRLAATVLQPAGSPLAGGFSDTQLDGKFQQLVAPVLGMDRTRAALDALWTMETLRGDEIATLLALPSA